VLGRGARSGVKIRCKNKGRMGVEAVPRTSEARNEKCVIAEHQ